VQVIARWQCSVALREALVVLYQAMCANLHSRIRMVIKITSKPCVLFFHCQLEKKSSMITISKLVSHFKQKTSNSALSHTLGQVARVLDMAYPSNPCRRKGERLTMVGVVGVYFVFRKTQKNALFPQRNSTEQ